MITAEEISDACARESVYFWTSVGVGSTRDVDGVGEIKVVDGNDSYQDDYSGRRFLILEIDGRLFRKDGMYYSHDGTYWDGPLYEVRRVTKTITDYEGI